MNNINKFDNISLVKGKDENTQQYLWRVDSLIRQGIYTNWSEVTPTVNKELFGDDDDMYKGESAYRKEAASARRFYEAGVFNVSDEDVLRELREEQDKLYAVKRQLADQRREYNKNVIRDGRANNLVDKLVECANKLKDEKPLNFSDTIIETGNKEALLIWSDWHYGMVTDNIWNTYNTEICQNRVKEMVVKTIEYLRLFKIKKLHIVNLGDAFHGAIHLSCRVASEEDTCDQLMHVSEIMANAIAELSNHVNEIAFYSSYGNHCRTIQNKDESVHADNMEKIIPWWIKERLKGNTKVHVYESEFKEFTVINILGYNICAVHGDLDNIKESATTINTLFSRKFNDRIDYIVAGDKHHLEEFERFDIEAITVRSMCGTDEYANNKRLYSCPGQTLMIFSEDEGRECTRYII